MVLRKGREISTGNFVGSIVTAPFVGSQGVQEDGLIIHSPVPRPGPQQLDLSLLLAVAALRMGRLLFVLVGNIMNKKRAET